MAFLPDIMSAVGVLGLGAVGVGWFAAHFIGAPVLALRKTRQEALEAADRYWAVSSSSSDETRDKAIKALNDAASTLAGYELAGSIAVRAYCACFGVDLQVAADCLRTLVEGPRGEYSVSDETQKLRRNALFVSLGATRRLSPAEIAAATEAIAASRRE